MKTNNSDGCLGAIVMLSLFGIALAQNIGEKKDRIEITILEKRLNTGVLLCGYEFVFEDCGGPRDVIVPKEKWDAYKVGDKITVARTMGWPIPMRGYTNR